MKVFFKLSKDQTLIGHCQLNYIAKNDIGQTLQYCLQDRGEKHGGIRLMRCSQDFEANYEIFNFKDEYDIEFEKPIIKSSDSEYTETLKRLCIQWIDSRHWETIRKAKGEL